MNMLESFNEKSRVPGTLNVVGCSPDVGRRFLFGEIRKQLGESTAELEKALYVCVGSERAYEAQKALYDVIKLKSREIALVQPSHPGSRTVPPFLRDYLTNSRARKYDAVYIDGSQIDFNPKETTALLDFTNEIKALAKDLNIPFFLTMPILDAEPSVLA